MKNIFYRPLAWVMFIFFLPFFAILYIVVKLNSKGSFIFKQERAGKDRKPFILYKIRTMIERADKLKNNYKHLNEADGPVFKIRDDPRYTKIGKFLAHTGLDELPQLINIIKGEMSFVGPRPLPVEEAARVPEKYERRFSVLPGITSLWVVKGTHNLNFDQWMRLDLEYISKSSIGTDAEVGWLTILLMIKQILRKILPAK